MSMVDSGKTAIKFNLVLVVENSASGKKYYSTSSGGVEIDGNLCEDKLVIDSDLFERVPLFFDKKYPIASLKVRIINLSSSDSTYFKAANACKAQCILYAVKKNTTTFTGAEIFFQGYIQFPENMLMDEDEVLLTIEGFHPDWHKPFPVHSLYGIEYKKVDGIWMSEKEEGHFPILIGQKVLTDDSDFEVAYNNGNIGKELVKKPFQLKELFKIETENAEYSAPNFMGKLNLTLCGITDIAIKNTDTDWDDRNKFLVNIKKYITDKWVVNPYEGFERGYATDAKEFEAGETMECGKFHKVHWSSLTDIISSNDILCIGMGNSEDEIYFKAAGARDILRRFWYAWLDGTSLKCQGVRINGLISSDDSVNYGVNTYVNSIPTDHRLWSKAFAYVGDESGTDYVQIGTFLYFYDTFNFYVRLITFSKNGTGTKFNFIDTITLGGSSGDFFHADGDLEDTSQGYNAILFTQNGGFVYDRARSTKLSQITEDANNFISGLSTQVAGCIAYNSSDGDSELFNTFKKPYDTKERLLYFASKVTTSTSLYIQKVVWGGLSYKTTSTETQATITLSTSNYRIVKCYIDPGGAGSYMLYTIFANKTDGTPYILNAYKRPSVSWYYREIELDIGEIYDVELVWRSASEAVVFFATSEGIYWCDALRMFSGVTGITMPTNYAESKPDSEVKEEFHKYSDRIVNVLTEHKLSAMSWKIINSEDLKESFARNNLHNIYLTGLNRDDVGLAINPSGWTHTNEIFFSTQFDNINELGWSGKAEIGISEQIDWEKVAGYLIHLAEGGSDYSYSPSSIDTSNWNTEMTKRKGHFDGQIRLDIQNQDAVINHVLKIMQQLGHLLYIDYSGTIPKLKIRYMFQPKGTPSVTLSKSNKNCSKPVFHYFSDYTSNLKIRFNMLNKRFFSYKEKDLPTIYGKEGLDKIIDLDMIYNYDKGYAVGKSGNLALENYLYFMLAWLSNYDPEFNTVGTPIRVVEVENIIPELYNTSLASDISIASDYPNCAGDYILIEKHINPRILSSTWVLLEYPDTTIWGGGT